MNMRRIAIVGLVLGILLVLDGAFMVIAKYNGGETQALNLPDGWIIIISAVIILVASVLALVLPGRSSAAKQSKIKSGVETEQG